MSEIIIQPPQPLAVTILQTDPALAQQVGGFAQTLTVLTNQINQAIASISQKANQSQIDALTTALDQINTTLAQVALELSDKADSTHTQPIATINGLTTALDDLQSQLAAVSTTLDSDLQAIAALSTQAFGRGLLTLADLAAARTLLQIPSIVDSPDDIGAQPADSDLSAIASLTTTSFGRGLLALADQAAAQAYIGAASGGGTPTAALLTYTISQSSSWNNQATWQGTYTTFTDASYDTGGVTNNEGSARAWIRADLGSIRTLTAVAVAGGLMSGLTIPGTDLNTATLEVSRDAVQWTPLFTFMGVTNTSRLHEFVTPTIAVRYVQITRAGLAGASQFRIFGY